MKDCTMCEFEQDGTMGDYCRLLEQEIDSLQLPKCQEKSGRYIEDGEAASVAEEHSGQQGMGYGQKERIYGQI